VSEGLSWRLRKNLGTAYRFSFVSNRRGSSINEQKSLGFNLSHLLYENLRTSAGLHGDENIHKIRESNEEIKERRYIGNLNFGYNRRIPWGKLRLGNSHNYEIVSKDRQAGVIPVTGEPVTLTIGDISRLNNKNVDTGSIEVWNTAHTRQYVEGSDYNISLVDSFVRIECLLGGDIHTDSDCITGAPVDVNYEYSSGSLADHSEYKQRYSINLNLWKFWDLFYNFSRSEIKFGSGEESRGLKTETSFSAGTKIKLKWRGISSFSSYVVSDETRSWNTNGSLGFAPLERAFLSLAASYGEIFFIEEKEVEDFIRFTSSFQMNTSRRTNLSLGAFWGQITGNQMKFTDSGLSSSFKVAYPKLYAGIMFKFLNSKDDILEKETERYSIEFWVKKKVF
jgi:hypothetical protein